MQTLDFKLHEFQRLSWVSRAIQEQWEHKLQEMATQLSSLLPTLFTDIYRVQLRNVYPHELDMLQTEYAKKNLTVQVLEFDDNVLGKFYLQFENDDQKISILIGKTEHIQHAVNAIENNDLQGYHQSLGTPLCCSHFLADLRRRKIQESIWPMGQTLHNREVKIQGHFATNILLNNLGINLLNHRPCRPDCESSIALAMKVISRGRQAGYESLFDDVQDVLSWSYSWSTLHGIAELKAPIFKLIYNSQACAVKYRLDWEGQKKPNTGLQGLGFPYQKSDKLIFSNSLSFKRGLENEIE